MNLKLALTMVLTSTSLGIAAADPQHTLPASGIQAPAPAATRPGWTLVWSDEFDVDGLPDATKWDYDTDRNKDGWYNQELQYYARDRLENASVKGGFLTLTARRERLIQAPDYGGQFFTSARMVTRNKPDASWTYGFVEVRAKLPCSLGTWPAIWMLGTGGRWPDDGEIDILEQKGTSQADKSIVQAALHTGAYNHAGGTLGKGLEATRHASDACTQFHNYQLTWSADKIVIGVDNKDYLTYTRPSSATYAQWPFDKPQYLLLNVAMGGVLGGTVPDSFVSDSMVVDYVRVYRK